MRLDPGIEAGLRLFEACFRLLRPDLGYFGHIEAYLAILEPPGHILVGRLPVHPSPPATLPDVLACSRRSHLSNWDGVLKNRVNSQQ